MTEETQLTSEMIQSALYRIAAIASSEVSLDELYHSIHEIIGELMYARNFYVALYDPREDLLLFPYYVDEIDPYPSPYKPEKGLTEYVIRTGTPLLITDEEHYHLIELGELELVGEMSKIWLGVPLKSRSETFGAMVVQHYSDINAFTEREKQVLTFVSGQVAAVIERKQAEEALLRSKIEWESTFNAISDWVSLLDVHSNRILRTNKAGENYLGVPVEEIVGKTCCMLLHGTEVPIENCPVVKLRLSSEKVSSKIEIEEKGKWLNINVDPVFDNEGKLVSAVHIVRDITERKEAEEAIQQRAAQLALLNEVGEEIAASLDVEDVLTRAARLVQERFGYHHVGLFLVDRDQGYAVMKTRAGYFDHLFPQHHRIKIGQGMVGWVVQHNQTLLANDVNAEPRYINYYPEQILTRSELSVPIQVGKEVIGALDIQSPQPGAFDASDVMVSETLAGQIAVAIENARLHEAVRKELSERKRAEEALRESEGRFRNIVESSPLGVHMYELKEDGSLIFIGANPAADRILGVDHRQFIGKTIEEAFPPLVNTEVPAAYRRAASQGIPWSMEQIDYEDQQIKGAFDVHAFQFSPGKMVTMFLEVTQRKQAEEEIRRLNDELEQRVVERTAQLEAANLELEAFSYSVSHDLRAPLRGIDGFSQALLEDYTDRLDAEGQEHLQRIRMASQRMAQLIDDLLKLSRVTRSEMQIKDVDLTVLASEIITELRIAHPERKVVFYAPESLTVKADADLMRIALNNLLSNAWKFTAKRPLGHIELGHLMRDGRKAYFVRDDGVGFDMHYVDKLFGAFQRLHSTAEFEGTGIGLAIVQRIVRRHSGLIWAESKIDQGATFFFTLG
jgi:PAS domain S-box-containing protein